MSTFTADRRSGCVACPYTIHPGDEVVRDLDHGTMHVDCPNELDTTASPSAVCPACWLTRAVNGACGCDA